MSPTYQNAIARFVQERFDANPVPGSVSFYQDAQTTTCWNDTCDQTNIFTYVSWQERGGARFSQTLDLDFSELLAAVIVLSQDAEVTE